MAKIDSYLNFNGNTEEAFNFYKSVFGGEFATLQRMRDTPDGEKLSIPEQQKIMHVALPIGTNTLMGTDMPEHMPPVTFGSNFSITVGLDSEEEAHAVYDALSAGGKATMPLARVFWGALFGMLTDKFGIQWMINYDDNQHL